MCAARIVESRKGRVTQTLNINDEVAVALIASVAARLLNHNLPLLNNCPNTLHKGDTFASTSGEPSPAKNIRPWCVAAESVGPVSSP